jgi:hypothetical protein
LGSGGSLVALTGSTAAPKVVLSGPHGQSITVPAGSVAPLMVRGFMVFQDPKHKTTYIAIQHSAGTWRITPQPGSSAITQVRSAKLLPSPKVSARVRGHGRRRTLKWHLRKIPGQRVVFWEKGRDSAKIIGSTSRPHGKLRFTIANASAGRRAIVAQVLSYGKPRKDLTIAHFHAPAPLKPAKPKHLKVTGVRGGGVRISWHRSALAQQYIIEIQTRDGAHLVEFASQHTHSITVHNVVPITAAMINVTGATHVGVRGRAASIRYTAQPKHHKHHKHRHGKHSKHRRHRH